MRTLFFALMTTLIFPTLIFAQDVFPQEQILPQEVYPQEVFPQYQEIVPQGNSPEIIQDGAVAAEPEKIDKRSDEERPVLGAILLPAENAVKIQSVFTNGPFHQTDIASDDLISELEDVSVTNQLEVDKFLLEKKPGDLIEVTRIRGTETEKVSVKLMSQKKLLEVSNTEGDSMASNSRQYVGDMPLYQPYRPDVLQQVDQRLKLMQSEIESLRAEIERQRKEALQREKAAKEKEGNT